HESLRLRNILTARPYYPQARKLALVTHRRCRCLLCGILPMPEHVHHIVKRLILYICICLLAGVGISGMTAFFHTSFSSTSS
ncbi:GGDEF domain-containing protein, partial [Acinetobacter baumannii]|nr:GGDEF domain-containing protein [Acinetobacter baumannii]